MPLVYYAANPEAWGDYRVEIPAALGEFGVTAQVRDTCDDPSSVDYLVYTPAGPVADFTPFTKAKAVLSLWAGVERIVGNATLTQPLCRMVDPGLSDGMTEWVVGQVLRYHLGLDRHITTQDGVWREHLAPPLARHRTVGILGLGVLGQAAARALAALNFDVLGWSRTEKSVSQVKCFAGDIGLSEVLCTCDILVLLLPETPATRGLMNDTRFALLRPGAIMINPGRGPLIEDDALLRALDSGQVSAATLDVFATEPLPPQHPFWAHPKITVTPHVASVTRPGSAARVIAENVARGEAGQPLLHVVDRGLGY
ncbi:MAG: glyoxylate/hydroxypyruvate reductase A [Pseudomonadota bacterium]